MNGVTVGVVLVALAGSGVALGDVTYKADTNPTGIPDAAQGNRGVCGAAAWADAMWYFQYTQGKDGLVPAATGNGATPATDWNTRLNKVRDDLATLYYGKDVVTGGKGYAALAAPVYIARQRPGDLGERTRTVRPGVTRTFTGFDWTFEQPEMNKASDVETHVQALCAPGGASRYSVGLFTWYEATDGPGNSEPAPMPVRGRDGVDKLVNGRVIDVRHELGFAGYDSTNREIVVTNGWDDNWQNTNPPPGPVSNTYYNKYTYTRGNNGGDPLRVTDPTLIGGNPPLFNGPAGLNGRTPAYAQLEHVTTLEYVGGAGAVPDYMASLKKRADGRADAYTCSMYFTNTTDSEVQEVFAELPFASASLPPTLELLDADLEPGWRASLWNPNEEAVFDSLMSTNGGYDELIPDGWGIGGIRFTAADGLAPGQSAFFEFTLDASLLASDTEFRVLVGGTVALDGTISVGVVPAPGAGVLAGVGCLVAGRRRPG